jgi:tRNA(fMet)-specific endonuclease VapC
MRKNGSLIEDSDLWIGVTAVVYNMIMVTENVKHLGRVSSIKLENWVEK